MYKIIFYVMTVCIVAPAMAADMKADIAVALPDDALTPGVVDAKVTQDNLQKTICKAGWAAKQRASARYVNKVKALQLKHAGVPPSKASSYAEDERIPLEVGGHATDPGNLWPEPLAGAWGAAAKDKLEAYIHNEVCAGRMKLKDGQVAFQKNWVEVFQLYCGPKPDAKCGPPGTATQIESTK